MQWYTDKEQRDKDLLSGRYILRPGAQHAMYLLLGVFNDETEEEKEE